MGATNHPLMGGSNTNNGNEESKQQETVDLPNFVDNNSSFASQHPPHPPYTPPKVFPMVPPRVPPRATARSSPPPAQQQRQKNGVNNAMRIDSPTISPRGVALNSGPTSPAGGKARMDLVLESENVSPLSSPLSCARPITLVAATVAKPKPKPHKNGGTDDDHDEDNTNMSHNNNNNSDDTTTTTGDGNNKSRRQKRLERNRESARLSRRRRKQYLEVLEERVSQLSHDMDHGRRQHVSMATAVIREKRSTNTTTTLCTTAQTPPSSSQPHSSYELLARTSSELRVACTFRAQQLASFCVPPATKLTLWLTLQNDDYFRGGRAASERLSAARIGERMLQNGNDKVTPSQTMWPLLCNEIGLSYDQEEKVRIFQRALLFQPETWLSRHNAFAAAKTMRAAHETNQALAWAIGRRERAMANILKPQQQSKLSAYVTYKRQELFAKVQAHMAAHKVSSVAAGGSVPDPLRQDGNKEASENKHELSKTNHVAANLYILHHRLQQTLKKLPTVTPIVTGPALKKLSRRPSFESLGARSGEKDVGMAGKHDSSSGSLSHSQNSSTGSLKRSASEMSMDSDPSNNNNNGDRHRPSVDPVDAQAKASHVVQHHLGHVQDIMPEFPVPVMSIMASVQTKPPLPPDAHAAAAYAAALTLAVNHPLAAAVPTPSPPSPVTQTHSQLHEHSHYDDEFMALGLDLPDPVPVVVLPATQPQAPQPLDPIVPLVAPSSSMFTMPPPMHLLPTCYVASSVDHVGQNNQYAGFNLMNSNTSSSWAEQQASLLAIPSIPGPSAAVEDGGGPAKVQRRAQSSFFPPALGVVPEEMWSAESAEDFLMSFVDDDEDWAIGGGIEMDM